MQKRVIIIGIVVLILAAIGFRLASNKKLIDEKKKPVLEANVTIPVNTATVHYQEVNDKLIKSGNLIPYKEADIMAISSGKLVSVNFELGSYVSKGAVVARVDNRGLQLNLEAAQLAKAKADKDLKRFTALLEGEATTEVSQQDAKLQFDNSVNQIELIQKQMADNNIKSPVSGQVVSKLKEAGEYVSPGTVLGHVVDVSRLKVNVMVGEKDAYTLKVGQPVTITTEIYPEVTFKGKVSFVSAQADGAHNYAVEIEMNNQKEAPLKAGTFVYADFARNSQQKLLLVPRTALIESLQNPMVYVVENGKAVVKKITIGRDIGSNIEVLNGLSENEEVIISGLVNIKEGSRVQPIGSAKVNTNKMDTAK